MAMANDLQTGYQTGAPTIIADLANVASAVYATVSGRPTSQVQTQVAGQQFPAQPTAGLLPLLLLGLVVWLVVRK